MERGSHSLSHLSDEALRDGQRFSLLDDCDIQTHKLYTQELERRQKENAHRVIDSAGRLYQAVNPHIITTYLSSGFLEIYSRDHMIELLRRANLLKEIATDSPYNV